MIIILEKSVLEKSLEGLQKRASRRLDIEWMLPISCYYSCITKFEIKDGHARDYLEKYRAKPRARIVRH